MNFNASRNVSHGGGPRRAKRVSDVSAMGTPPPPGFTQGPPPSGFTQAPYNPGFAPAGQPPPYSDGVHLDPAQGYTAPSPGGDFNYMGGFGQTPMTSPAQLGAMLQTPVVQDMALQYGNQLAQQGREAMKREINKYVPVSKLRYYFAVDTRYVVKKLMLIMFPFTHKEWMVKYEQDTPVQPRYDINAPDLYIPSMGYVTYVLLTGFMLGLQHRFSPEQIGIQSSSALAYILFEMLLYLMTLYITNTTTSLRTLDLLAFSGYKYTVMIASLIAGLFLGKTGYYSCLVYTSLALSYFLVKTLRLQLLAGSENHSAPQQQYDFNNPYATPNPYAESWSKSSSGGTKRRLYFLLFVALTQPLLSWWLTYHLVPSQATLPLQPTR